MRTREELVNRALSKLHVLAAGQAASAEDYAVADNDLEPVLADLSSRGVYAYGDPDQIEDDAFVHLADILANSVAADFGREQNDAVRLAAERRLRVLGAETLSYQPAQAEYF